MTTTTTVKVWDLAIRVFHWSLVAFFTIAYLSGDELETVHAWSGYIIIALILFRFAYGFVGTKYARFSDFIKSPAAVKYYLQQLFSGSPKRYLGHNPAGGWMVVVLLVSLAVSSWTGLKAYADEGHGPLAGTDISLIGNAYADSDTNHDRNEKGGEHKDEFWEEVHEVSVNFTLFMVLVHITGVLVSSWLENENLIKAMITGKKSAE
jgi:cytochrome b